MSNGQANAEIAYDRSPCLTCLHEAPIIGGAMDNDTVGAQCAHMGRSGQDNQAVASGHVLPERSGVRRLTPLECERLQGMPDNWTKVDEKSSDTARYKAIGNSMALPCSDYVLSAVRRMIG